MIIHKIYNYYIIKLIGTNINIYNPNNLEEITKKIITKVSKLGKIENCIHLEFYQNEKYGTIIKLTDYNSPFQSRKEKTVKITIHTNTIFLYQINYFDIDKEKLSNSNIYYYKNKFYLELKNDISTKDYINILELSEVIYEDTQHIIDKGIKI